MGGGPRSGAAGRAAARRSAVKPGNPKTAKIDRTRPVRTRSMQCESAGEPLQGAIMPCAAPETL